MVFLIPKEYLSKMLSRFLSWHAVLPFAWERPSIILMHGYFHHPRIHYGTAPGWLRWLTDLEVRPFRSNYPLSHRDSELWNSLITGPKVSDIHGEVVALIMRAFLL